MRLVRDRVKQKKSKKGNRYSKKRKRATQKRKQAKKSHSKKRKYVTDTKVCLCLNKRLPGFNAHHVDTSIVIYLPVELHQHLSHNIRSREGMDEMNMLAFQFLWGWW